MFADTLEALENDRGYHAYHVNTVRAHYDNGWTPSTIREARATYADMGLRPIALEGKTPPKGATDWNEDPTRTWKALPRPTNVGILGGDGVAIVDVDKTGAWTDLFDLPLAQLADRTPVAVTGSGGIHVYARHPLTETPCGSLPGDAGELIGGGWHAVAPPSQHPETGLEYRWSQEPTRIADLDELHPTWSLDDIGTQEDTQTPPTGVEAPSGRLEDRVDAYLETNPILADKVDTLLAGQSDDRSRDEFAICVGLLEGPFDRLEVRTWLKANGPKARERGEAYAGRTIESAAKEA
jgi:hypothetical protein